MEQYALSIESKKTLNEYGKGFRKWKETETGQKEMQAQVCSVKSYVIDCLITIVN